MRRLVRLLIAAGWLFWLLVGFVLFAAFGFGARHDILATAALFVGLPLVLLSLQRFGWRSVHPRTLSWVGLMAGLLYALIAVATIQDWIGATSQR
jgi:hypothetical protein